MVTFLVNNWGTIIVSLILIAIVALIIRKMVSDRRKGKLSCGCDCGGCAARGSCGRK